MAKKIYRVSGYGRSVVWKRRRDGVWQRYWVSTRFDLRGTGPELKRAIVKIKHERLIPRRRFVRVSASKFLRAPHRYAYRGPTRWEFDTP